MKRYQHFKSLSTAELKQIKGGISTFSATRYRCFYLYPGDTTIYTFYICTDSPPVPQNCPEGTVCNVVSSTCTNPTQPEFDCPVNP